MLKSVCVSRMCFAKTYIFQGLGSVCIRKRRTGTKRHVIIMYEASFLSIGHRLFSFQPVRVHKRRLFPLKLKNEPTPAQDLFLLACRGFTNTQGLGRHGMICWSASSSYSRNAAILRNTLHGPMSCRTTVRLGGAVSSWRPQSITNQCSGFRGCCALWCKFSGYR